MRDGWKMIHQLLKKTVSLTLILFLTPLDGSWHLLVVSLLFWWPFIFIFLKISHFLMIFLLRHHHLQQVCSFPTHILFNGVFVICMLPLPFCPWGHSRSGYYFWVSNGLRIFLDNFTYLVCLNLYCGPHFGSYLHFILHIEYTDKVYLQGIGSSKISFWFFKGHSGVLS
jgi:hypothetical protein